MKILKNELPCLSFNSEFNFTKLFFCFFQSFIFQACLRQTNGLNSSWWSVQALFDKRFDLLVWLIAQRNTHTHAHTLSVRGDLSWSGCVSLLVFSNLVHPQWQGQISVISGSKRTCLRSERQQKRGGDGAGCCKLDSGRYYPFPRRMEVQGQRQQGKQCLQEAAG